MKKVGLILLMALLFKCVYSQVSNNDSKAGVVNVNLPKTPESQGFEKYGNYSVSEFTGSPGISIPIYNLSSRFLQVPITLSYNSSGIRVNQEASWVGLGFDLIAGGRITVETKGAVDFTEYHEPNLQYGMQKLFDRLGNSNEFGILTYASTCHGCDPAVTGNIPDDASTIESMAQFGIGEPDIYHANFLGNSVSFYFDKITGALKFIGEKGFLSIGYNKDASGKILDWTINDRMGNTYYFAEREVTSLKFPTAGTLSTDHSSTTAWLLTKIAHPTGDNIVFKYTGYGNRYPAFSWSTSVSYMIYDETLSLSPDGFSFQNTVTEQPKYLTKIETNDVVIDFLLGTRTDLKGEGSRRLEEIKISDKKTLEIKKKVIFSYDYFTGSLDNCYSSLSETEKNYYKLRLKLTALYLDGISSTSMPYRFFYYSAAGVPDKYSFSQDHWGFYNGIANNALSDDCSPKNLIPRSNLGDVYNEPFLNGYAISRECNPNAAPAMTLDSIIYPTGGSTKFIYEPHQTSLGLGITGGGLRIKTIKNYALAKLTGMTEYTYSGGTYMGALAYHTTSYALARCPGTHPGSDQQKEFLSSNGAINDNDFLVGYAYVTKMEKSESGVANGYVTKQFSIANPRYSTGGYGFDVLPAHWPSGAICDPPGSGNCITHNNTTLFLYPQVSGFAPTPHRKLDGKLLKEEYYNNTPTLLKSIDYYYSLTDYSQNFYSVKVFDNRIGGFDAPGSCGFGQEFTNQGQRRFTTFVSPAKSFHILTDSIVEKTFDGNNSITQKKEYKYNSVYQQEYEISYNSDGTQTIVHNRYPEAFTLPYGGVPTGYGMEIFNMGKARDYLIEQTIAKKDLTGKTMVIGGRFNVYKGPLIVQHYKLESGIPLELNNGFAEAKYKNVSSNSYDIEKDNHYQLKQDISYNLNSLITDIDDQNIHKSFIWDESYNAVLAQCVEGNSSEIAFTSFETSAKGNWSNVGTSTDEATSPTGKKCYEFNGNNYIVKSDLSTGTAYIVSYWTKNTAAFDIPGTATGEGYPKKGKTISGWTYYEHKIEDQTSVSIGAGSTGFIDEVRLYPLDAQMTTYTYDPLIGMTSQCDVNNKISYYLYDELGRLKLIKDQDKFIIKRICYSYEGQQIDCDQVMVGNTQQSGFFTKQNCTYPTTYEYVVPANTYYAVDVATANALAQNQIATNGQAYANSQACDNDPPCPPNSCTGVNKKCINGRCRTGFKIYTESVEIAPGSFKCTFHYEWPWDNTRSADDYENSTSHCAVQ